MPDGYQSVPVLMGSLLLCTRCWCVVPRWAAGRHDRALHPPLDPPEGDPFTIWPTEPEAVAP